MKQKQVKDRYGPHIGELQVEGFIIIVEAPLFQFPNMDYACSLSKCVKFEKDLYMCKNK